MDGRGLSSPISEGTSQGTPFARAEREGGGYIKSGSSATGDPGHERHGMDGSDSSNPTDSNIF
ncbi:unnamed protein product [Spirodela intermedia]|uniref:Uncharacterized protein n=1 Tax=Spirodela intermedia TaxID=51605 RepID=A0A7I8IL53_SPIIN|nr:unnamed protein product [Spirodela intermedia]CAA6658257.1 unnamed protein product [Spirodela intermedia]